MDKHVLFTVDSFNRKWYVSEFTAKKFSEMQYTVECGSAFISYTLDSKKAREFTLKEITESCTLALFNRQLVEEPKFYVTYMNCGYRHYAKTAASGVVAISMAHAFGTAREAAEFIPALIANNSERTDFNVVKE